MVDIRSLIFVQLQSVDEISGLRGFDKTKKRFCRLP